MTLLFILTTLVSMETLIIIVAMVTEGEQEAAWLQEAGYGVIVSRYQGKL